MPKKYDGTIELQEVVDPKAIQIAKDDPAQIIETMFKIVDKKNQVVKFKLNPAQRRYYDKRTPRDDILKARKEGFSSLILAILTVKFLFLENVNVVCISHEKDATRRLLQKVKYYINNLELPNGQRIYVNLKHNSKNEMIYSFTRQDKNGRYYTVENTFYIGTAGSKAFGRGDNIHYLHMSEVAFWENPGVIMTGLLNAVPDDFNSTYVVKESTANGAGTYHHREWLREKSGEGGFTPHFFGWHEDPENRMSLEEYKRRTGKDFVPTLDEKQLATRYRLTLEQMAWRRWKISTMQPDKPNITKEDLFRQEYPLTDEEAFLSSSKSIFDSDTLEFYETYFIEEPKFIGELIGWYPPVFRDNPNGELRIWKKPEYGHRYVIGVDVAEENNYSVAVVIDREAEEQVAEYRGRPDVFELAAIVARLGLYYNEALVGVERNNQGVAVVKKLQELEYPNQYIRTTIDKRTSTQRNEYGWVTDKITRPIAINDLLQEVKTKRYVIRSKYFINEARTFVRSKRGRAEAMRGTHDDVILAHAIALQMFKTLPTQNKEDFIIERNYRPKASVYSIIRNRR